MGVKEKPDIIDIIEKKRLHWYGHVKRMQEERIPKLIMEWIPGERRKRYVQEKRGWKVYE
jgi:IS5 family transposase